MASEGAPEPRHDRRQPDCHWRDPLGYGQLGTPSMQTFPLPAGTSAPTGKPFWSGDVVKGFKYKDSKGENGPVKVPS
jgi:hypothetical protein